MNITDERRKVLIKELVGSYGITRLEVAEESSATESIEYQDSDECAWRRGKDNIYRCQQRPGESCKAGSCKGITITFTDKNGTTKTVSYCECSGAP